MVPHGAPADARAEELFARLKEIGFACALISNNKGPRVQMFNENIHAYTVCDAHKPNPENYLKAAALMDVPKEKVLFIGDQIFTDIWAPGERKCTVFLCGQSIRRRKFRSY